jgi:alpha-glucosidase
MARSQLLRLLGLLPLVALVAAKAALYPLAPAWLRTEDGGFSVTVLDGDAPKIAVTHSSSRHATDIIVWESSDVDPLLVLSSATQLRPPIANGNYQVQCDTTPLSNRWRIASAKTVPAEDKVQIDGSLLECKYGDGAKLCTAVATFSVAFSLDEPQDSAVLPAVRFEVTVEPSVAIVDGAEFHVSLAYACAEDETFSGFGESFAPLDLRGRLVPVLVSEQGLGRGVQPLTEDMNTQKGEGVGGHWFTTYAPKPLYVTNRLRSFLLHTTYPSYFDLRRTDARVVSVEVWTTAFAGQFSVQETAPDLVESLTLVTGRQPRLADWTQHGAVLGLEGGTDVVTEQVTRMLAGGTAVVGVWLQDWVGRRHSWDGDRLIWNWQLDPATYPNWTQMVRAWNAARPPASPEIRVLTYLNPFFSDPSNFTDTGRAGFRNFFAEGLARGYFVQRPAADGAGTEPYLQQSLSITFATLDVTNAAAVRWMQAIIRDEVLNATGAAGWMCDFGEYLPFDAVFPAAAAPTEAAALHNAFPEHWARLTAEALQQAGRADDVVFFARAAFVQSPRHVPLFWLGDQLQSWDAYDGLASLFLGSLSSGLSGHAVTHSDVGGYNAVLPAGDGADDDGADVFVRDAELLARWAEAAAFSHAVLRTHVGSSLDGRVAQVYDSAETVAAFARSSRVFAALAAYRREELLPQAQRRGWPLTRPLFFHYAPPLAAVATQPMRPALRAAWAALFNESRSFLFGRDFLVTPTVARGALRTEVTFPRRWACDAAAAAADCGETWIHLVRVPLCPALYLSLCLTLAVSRSGRATRSSWRRRTRRSAAASCSSSAATCARRWATRRCSTGGRRATATVCARGSWRRGCSSTAPPPTRRAPRATRSCGAGWRRSRRRRLLRHRRRRRLPLSAASWRWAPPRRWSVRRWRRGASGAAVAASESGRTRRVGRDRFGLQTSPSDHTALY